MGQQKIVKIYHHRVRVDPEDIDAMGHINNVSYVAWMQEAAIAHSTANGWDLARYQSFGAGWVARQHRIEYLRPGFQEDDLMVQTWVFGLKRVSSTRHYHVVRASDKAVIAKAETQWAFVDLLTQTPRKIPPEISQSFEVIEF